MPAQLGSRSENRGERSGSSRKTQHHGKRPDPQCHEAPASTTGLSHLLTRFEGRFRGGGVDPDVLVQQSILVITICLFHRVISL